MSENLNNKKIGNLEFRKASYLLPKEPENPAYHIDYWYPNGYYGKESNYVKVDEDWYCYPDNHNCRIHKDCFKNPLSAMAIGSFNYKDGCYEFSFIGERPVRLTLKERDDFWELIKYGFKQLNKNDE